MTLARQTILEIARAVCVLGLLLLNLAPATTAPAGNAAIAVHVEASVYAVDMCGDPADAPAAHAPCHACRASIATLPPSPIWVRLATARSVDYDRRAAVPRAKGQCAFAEARGPPILV